jgi:acetoin utilization deacetylase AcuC-like enzyme
VVLATGADGHKSDRLAGLNYEVEDFVSAAEVLRQFTEGICGGRIYIGGAGGYEAEGTTPQVYAAVYATLDGPE